MVKRIAGVIGILLLVNSGLGQIETEKPGSFKTLPSIGHAFTSAKDISNVSKLRPGSQGGTALPQRNFSPEEVEIIKGKRGIIAATFTVDVSSSVVAVSSYIACGIKFFKILDILAGIGSFGVGGYGEGYRYGYRIIGAKARVPLSFLMFSRRYFFGQFGAEWGWGTGSWKDKKGSVLSFGMGYEIPVCYLHSLEWIVQLKTGSEPMCLTVGLGIGLRLNFYLK